MITVKDLTRLFDKVAGYKEGCPSVGRKFQLLGLIAETIDMVALLKGGVLKQVTEKLTMDADVDINYMQMAEDVMLLELHESQGEDKEEGCLLENLAATELKTRMEKPVMDVCTHVMMAVDNMTTQQLTSMENEALSELSSVMIMIADELDRIRKDEDYARLYEEEWKRFIASPTARSARKNFELWLISECSGHPSLEDVDDYVLSKVLRIFEVGILDVKVLRMQRGKHFPGEIDFDVIDDGHRLKKSINKYYMALRKMVDYKDGCLVPDAASIGRFFYTSRKDRNAKVLRTNFMKYMLKISMAQELRRKLIREQAEAGKQADGQQLNYFAPMVHLQELLKGEWFKELRCSNQYDEQWTDRFVWALMTSEWRDQIAHDWSAGGARNRRTQIKGYIVGLLKDAGVLKGSYDSIARMIDATDDSRVFSKYMGNGKQQPYEEWVKDYISKD